MYKLCTERNFSATQGLDLAIKPHTTPLTPTPRGLYHIEVKKAHSPMTTLVSYIGYFCLGYFSPIIGSRIGNYIGDYLATKKFKKELESAVEDIVVKELPVETIQKEIVSSCNPEDPATWNYSFFRLMMMEKQ